MAEASDTGAVAVTEELLLALGQNKKKIPGMLKNNKLVPVVSSLVGLYYEATQSEEVGNKDHAKWLFQAAEKLQQKSDGARKVFIDYMLKPDGESIADTKRIKAAIKYLSAQVLDVDEDEFKESAGVGLVITQDTIREPLRALVQDRKDDVMENMYPFMGQIQGEATKSIKELQFAANDDVMAVLEAAFAELLGPKTPENTQKKKGGKGGKGKGKGAPPAAKKAEEPAAEVGDLAKLRAEMEEGELQRKEHLLGQLVVDFPELEGKFGELKAKYIDGAAAGSEQKITGTDIETGGKAIDYTLLVDQWGTQLIDDKIIARFEKITGQPAHYMLKRGIFFSHRDLEQALDAYEAGEPFYLYTGRGPSSASMHIGHLVPLRFTKYLQDAFQCNCVIQMTDDEKYLYKDFDDVEDLAPLLRQNVKDIISLGFNREKTFIFSDFEYMGGAFYKNVIKMQKRMTANRVSKTMGLEPTDCIGKFAYSATQAAPAFSSSFPHIFGAKSNNQCLIPCAIDQDVYFRTTRDSAPSCGFKKPAVIHSVFLPAMEGPDKKMSSSVGAASTVFLDDDMEKIKATIHKYAFSGAPNTLEELERDGANLEIDVSYQYLRFFMVDDAKLADIGARYGGGKMKTAEIKDELTSVIQEICKAHQAKKATVTDEEIDYFMNTDPARFQSA